MLTHVAPAQAEPFRAATDQPHTPARPACEAVPAPATGAKRRGNPDLGLALRCGARTRAGGACLAPAIRGKLRCRMHGGRSTGPRTAEGKAHLAAARTLHGGYGAEARGRNRQVLSQLRRGRVGNDACRYADVLPAALALRLWQMPAELLPLVLPPGGLTPAQDRAVLRAETEALAPWKAAIGLAKHTGCRVAPSLAGAGGATVTASVEPHVPDAHGGLDRLPAAVASVADDGVIEPHAPDAQVAVARPDDQAQAMTETGVAEAPAPASRQGAAHPDNAAGAAEADAMGEPHVPDSPAGATPLDAPVEAVAENVAAGPHAPDTLVHAVSLDDAAGAGATYAAAEPHAPEAAPTSAAVAPAREAMTCAAARRWHRQQRYLTHAPMAVAATAKIGHSPAKSSATASAARGLVRRAGYGSVVV